MSGPPSRSGRPANILLVEDNPGDVRLVEETFKDACLANDLHVVTDGDEAIEYVYQRGEYADAPRPDVVLLDWNLPRMGGDEVLAELKAESALRSIPVIVLTGSQAQEDVVRSDELQANAYVTKPVEPVEFIEVVQSFEEFWLRIVRLPRCDD